MVCFWASSASSVTNRVLGKRIKILDLKKDENSGRASVDIVRVVPCDVMKSSEPTNLLTTPFSASLLLSYTVHYIFLPFPVSPAQFVFLRFVVEVFDQNGDSL